MELNEIKSFLESVNKNNISFSPHFYKRTSERPISEGMVRKFLFQIDKLEKIERGKGEDRFKLWFIMSRKYSLVLIIEVVFSKDLKVISAWNSNRKWQKQLKK